MDNAQPQIWQHESDAVSILSTVIAQTVLNIHRIHDISMTNEHIWMQEHLNFKYEPSVAVLQFFRI